MTDSFQHSSLRIFFSLLRQFSNAIHADEGSNALKFDVPYFQKIMRAILCPSQAQTKSGRRKVPASGRGAETSPDISELLLETWLNKYADIKWFFLREAGFVFQSNFQA